MPTALSTRPSDSSEFFTLSFPEKLMREMREIHNEIARTAFRHYQERDAMNGSALDDWLRAESELLEPVPVNIRNEKDRLMVTAEVPGFSMDQLKVHVDGNDLKICGKAETSEKSGRGETSSSRRICCELMLPASVKAESATAKLDQGVLTLTLPKAEPAKEIQIKAAA